MLIRLMLGTPPAGRYPLRDRAGRAASSQPERRRHHPQRSPRLHCLRFPYDRERWRSRVSCAEPVRAPIPWSAFRWRLSWKRTAADDRAEVDDAPAVGPEPLDRLLHGENRPQNVDVVVEVKALFGDLREGAEAEDPGVVDQNVQSSERRIHFFE